jgi:predicted nucleic acid-binding protein
LKLYFDLCVYNRPFDYQGQERVALETSAFIYLLEKIEKGSHVLITSQALIYENNKGSDEQRKVRVASFFNLAREFVGADFSDEERVNVLKELGFPDMDALHIALAEKSQADCFVTCDDDIIKLFKKHKNLVKVDVVSLIELISLEVK